MILPDVPQDARAVADHYDELDPFYREVWGEHVHHGLWRSGRESRAEATEALSLAVADRLGIARGDRLVDIGCGYGATARLFARRFGAQVTGFTVAARQAAHAPPCEGVTILHRDWLENDLTAGSIDGAYAIESSEHFVDKPRFFAEAYRVLRPGGRLVLCVWLAAERPKGWEVRHLLEPICREGRLPSMGSEAEYRAMAATAGFTAVGPGPDFEDVSRQVRRTWDIIIGDVARRLATSRRYRAFLRDARAHNRIFVATLPRLALAYRSGAMRYGIFLFRKPDSAIGGDRS